MTECAVCGQPIPATITKAGKVHGQAKKYCGRVCRCRRPRVRQVFVPKVRAVDCHGCGITSERAISRGMDAATYCSGPCYQRSRDRVASEARVLRSFGDQCRAIDAERISRARRIEATIRHAESVRLRMVCSCQVCGVGFEQGTHMGRKEVRCAPCAALERTRVRRVTHSKRRALMRTVEVQSIDPMKVFARDGWQCQLCQLILHPKDRGTYKAEAPEMDHIIPLAKGGAHTWANVQCTCRQCNALKSDTMPLMKAA